MRLWCPRGYRPGQWNVYTGNYVFCRSRRQTLGSIRAVSCSGPGSSPLPGGLHRSNAPLLRGYCADPASVRARHALSCDRCADRSSDRRAARCLREARLQEAGAGKGDRGAGPAGRSVRSGILARLLLQCSRAGRPGGSPGRPHSRGADRSSGCDRSSVAFRSCPSQRLLLVLRSPDGSDSPATIATGKERHAHASTGRAARARRALRSHSPDPWAGFSKGVKEQPLFAYIHAVRPCSQKNPPPRHPARIRPTHTGGLAPRLPTAISIVAGLLQKWTVGLLWEGRASFWALPSQTPRRGHGRLSSFSKEIVKPISLKSTGLLSIFAEVHAAVMRFYMFVHRTCVLRSAAQRNDKARAAKTGATVFRPHLPSGRSREVFGKETPYATSPSSSQ